ncbi:hypothetical protein CSA56_08005 [candidate division KSB3 bacterium]|uniref:Transcriptional regulator LacI/GalR-like sensor domain-containing protein n=1 Tax=candidate division KSB3 bacterium TaxID=2044937 RepID=A0A2G6KF73_9BACT|nr:MAG: hypothetical protein CSA56_08005 [candidate division KSB3 bacterium]
MFVFSDDIALYVMEVLIDCGYKIPEDISVIGCGNMRLAEQTIPPMTTVDQHHYEMGVQGVEMLLQHIHAPQKTACEVKRIEPRLIVRESCRKV